MFHLGITGNDDDDDDVFMGYSTTLFYPKILCSKELD
jgi:hypothetical protein